MGKIITPVVGLATATSLACLLAAPCARAQSSADAALGADSARAAAAEGSQPGAAAQAPVAAPAAAAAEASVPETVTVTARKRAESIAEVPTSITAFTAQSLEDFNINSFNDYATKTPNLSFSYGGGPTGIADARSIAIRGITGQNLFGTAGATGFYIDDTPIPGSVDPRVLDIDNIEVLKGPQGTLYGESSLGGNVRLVTRQPSLVSNELSYQTDVGATSGGGSADGGLSAIGNIVVVPNSLAVRVVAFGDQEAGYLTRTYPTDPTSPGVTDPNLDVPRTSVGDQGAITTFGGSITALWRPIDALDIRLRFMHQQSHDHGFPATFAPLPEFSPDYILNRAFDVQPYATDTWSLPSLDINYRGSGWSLVSSTSWFYRHTLDLEDSTYGTQEVLSGYYGVTGLPTQPFLWDGQHEHRQITEETRVTFDPFHGWSGTLGLFYENTRTKFYIPPTYADGLPAATLGNTVVGPWPNDEIWQQFNPGTEKDTSIFGEAYYKFLPQWTLTLGARVYWLQQYTDFTANGFMNFGATPSDPQSNRQSGVDPKIALAYQATDEAMVYASASKGFRAGGAQAYAPFCSLPTLPDTDITQLRSDTLWTYELGTKVQLADPNLLISAAGFHIDWMNPQQQVALPCGYYFDINAQEARVDGGEVELLGHVAEGLQLRGGIGYESTNINEPGALGIPGIGVQPGSRLPGVPAWTASVGAVYRHPLTGQLTGFLSADYSFTGDSISLLNGGTGLNNGEGLTATRPSWSLANVRFGVDWGDSELSLNVHNLSNAKPNLGDIGYVGYAQFQSGVFPLPAGDYPPGNPIPQVATLQPLTVTLEFRQTLF
ncbi:MAG TPA: TonB-dependent receptor [Steroidobacteraceae bacterium]|nr:TonB-dependent receptor [Steroidobacteraceae bacterium]